MNIRIGEVFVSNQLIIYPKHYNNFPKFILLENSRVKIKDEDDEDSEHSSQRHGQNCGCSRSTSNYLVG